MTTKPRAKKFRIRSSGSLNASPDASEATQDAVSGEVTDAREVSVEEEIDNIRKEGLTGRQLRMARRVAQKHGLAPTSDFDAIRLLRAKGVDPFQRANMLELPANKTNDQTGQPKLPNTVPMAKTNLPSTEVDTAGARAREILKIQRDIARRRRLKLVLLFTRLAFFVLLPTFMVGYYYYEIATPMYATKSQFVIQKASPAGGNSKMGGLLSGTGLATSQDSIIVQSYLQSRGAMLRLDTDFGFKSHFSQDTIDPIQRLDKDATNEQAYRLYEKRVVISYDPTEGIIKMEVVAADPEVSATYSKALISYAEERVDQITARSRADQMRGAQESYEKAEKEMKDAQERVVELKERSNIISSDVAISLLTSKISTLEQVLVQDELTLEELKSNLRPNPAKVDPLERKIASLRKKIAGYYDDLTAGSSNGESLARLTSQLTIAQADLETRNVMMQAALQQMETAQIAANRQTRYLEMGVSPTPPDEATYPRKFENTILAFLIFAGAYLMISLTASILREQVTA